MQEIEQKKIDDAKTVIMLEADNYIDPLIVNEFYQGDYFYIKPFY